MYPIFTCAAAFSNRSCHPKEKMDWLSEKYQHFIDKFIIDLDWEMYAEMEKTSNRLLQCGLPHAMSSVPKLTYGVSLRFQRESL